MGIPRILVPPPCGFGISTALTAGGKYVPEDILTQILYRLFFRSASNSSMDCPSTPAAPFFSLTLLYAFHTRLFGMSNGCGSSGGTSCGSWNGAVEVAGLVDALLFLTEVPCPVGVEVAVAVEGS